MNRAPIYVFDLDGTISDPALGFLRSVNYALESFGHQTISATDASKFIGPPLDDTFRELTGSTSAPHVADLVRKYRERYADVGYAENTLYDGIAAALATLARESPLALCTTKRTDFAQKILALFNLDHLFSVVSGGDIGIEKSAQLKELLRSAKISSSATMTGDRAIDIRAARENGLRAVGVLWGHGSREELAACEPDLLLHAPTELNRLAHPSGIYRP